MNHHDTSQQPTPTALCARIAPLLPALDEWGELSAQTLAGDAPSSDELALAFTHLATCAYCQAQRDAYARLDVALHNTVGLRAIAPLRTADIMAGLLRSQPNTLPTPAEMGAEMAPTPTIATATIATSIAAPVALAGPPARMPAPSVASSPAVPPSARSVRASSPRKRWAPAWLAVVAAALVVALLAAGIVRSVGARVGSGLVGAKASPTSTTSAYSGGLFGEQGPALTDITMVSPTEGWAIGPSQPGKPSLIYHLLDNAWTPVTLTGAARRVAISTPSALAFASPTDGWAFFSQASHALHYDGHSWQAPLNTFGSASAITCDVSAFQLVAPTDGWGVCANPTPDNQSLLHYDGHVWSTVALPDGLNTTLDVHHSVIPNTDIWLTDLSMQSATQGWAVGYVAGTGANSNQLSIGFILQYKDGKWSVSARYNGYELRSVSALASGDAWAAGDLVSYQCNVVGTPTAEHVTLFRCNGPPAASLAALGSAPAMLNYRQGQWSWVQLPLPAPDPKNFITGTFTQVLMRSPTDGWALGSETYQSQTKSGPQVISTSLVLLHYDGVRWQPMTTGLPPAPAITRYTILGLGVSSNGDCWAVGQIQQGQGNHVTNSPLIQRYHDGRWNSIYMVVVR